MTQINRIASKKIRARAVIFDIDGTLYRNSLMILKEPLVYIRSFMWMMRYHRMRLDLRKKLMQSVHEIIAGKITDRLWRNSIAIFSQQLKISLSQSEYILRKHIYDTWISAVRSIPLRIGMRSLLGTLHRNGVPLGILSDFKADEKLKQWNIDTYFSSIICAEDYGVLKPRADIFVLCCKELRCQPHEVIFVGNSVRYDGIGAKNAGLISVLFHHKKHFIEDIYDIPTINTVSQLIQILSWCDIPL